MPDSDIFSFKYEEKGFPDAAKANFMENARDELVSRVKDGVGNLTRGVLDVEGSVEGDKISIKIIDRRSSTSSENSSGNLFNEKTSDEFFNMVTEDEFKDRVKNEARKLHPEIMRLFLESQNIFARK